MARSSAHGSVYYAVAPLDKTHVCTSLRDVRFSLCGVKFLRRSPKWERVTWIPMTHGPHPPVTCKSCIRNLMGKVRYDESDLEG